MIVNADDEIGQQILQAYDTAIAYGINSPSDAFCIDINKECNSYIMNIFINQNNFIVFLSIPCLLYCD